MKTKRILTLLIALLIGVYVSAQSFPSEVPKPNQHELDYLKQLWVLEYGMNTAFIYYLLYLNQPEPPAPPVKQGNKYSKMDSQPVIHIADANKEPAHYVKRRPRFNKDFNTKTYSNNNGKRFK